MKKNKRWNSSPPKMHLRLMGFEVMPQQAENIGIRESGFLLFLCLCIYKGIACQRKDAVIHLSTTLTLIDKTPNLC